MKKKIVILLTILISLISLLSCSSSEKKAIKIVKEGTYQFTQKTIDEASKEFFKKYKYDAYYDNDGFLYVSLKGKVDTSSFIKGFKKDKAIKEAYKEKKKELDEIIKEVEKMINMYSDKDFDYIFKVDIESQTFKILTLYIDGLPNDSAMYLYMLFRDYKLFLNSMPRKLYFNSAKKYTASLLVGSSRLFCSLLRC